MNTVNDYLKNCSKRKLAELLVDKADENKALRENNKTLIGQRDEQAQEVRSLKRLLDTKKTEISYLEKALDSEKQKVQRLEMALEDAQKQNQNVIAGAQVIANDLASIKRLVDLVAKEVGI